MWFVGGKKGRDNQVPFWFPLPNFLATCRCHVIYPFDLIIAVSYARIIWLASTCRERKMSEKAALTEYTLAFGCHLLRLVLQCWQQQSAELITAQSVQAPAKCHFQGPAICYGTPNGYRDHTTVAPPLSFCSIHLFYFCHTFLTWISNFCQKYLSLSFTIWLLEAAPSSRCRLIPRASVHQCAVAVELPHFLKIKTLERRISYELTR